MNQEGLNAGDQVRVHSFDAYAGINWTWTGTVLDAGYRRYPSIGIRVDDPGTSPMAVGDESSGLSREVFLMRTAEQVRLASAVRPPEGGRTLLDPAAVRNALSAAGFGEHKQNPGAWGFAVGDAVWRSEWDKITIEARPPENERVTGAAETQAAILHEVYAETLQTAGFTAEFTPRTVTVTLPQKPGADSSRQALAARGRRASAWPRSRRGYW